MAQMAKVAETAKIANTASANFNMRIVRILSHRGTIISEKSHFSQCKKIKSDSIQQNGHRKICMAILTKLTKSG